jgi:hypothetical protein
MNEMNSIGNIGQNWQNYLGSLRKILQAGLDHEYLLDRGDILNRIIYELFHTQFDQFKDQSVSFLQGCPPDYSDAIVYDADILNKPEGSMSFMMSFMIKSFANHDLLNGKVLTFIELFLKILNTTDDKLKINDYELHITINWSAFGIPIAMTFTLVKKDIDDQCMGIISQRTILFSNGGKLSGSYVKSVEIIPKNEYGLSIKVTPIYGNPFVAKQAGVSSSGPFKIGVWVET